MQTVRPKDLPHPEKAMRTVRVPLQEDETIPRLGSQDQAKKRTRPRKNETHEEGLSESQKRIQIPGCQGLNLEFNFFLHPFWGVGNSGILGYFLELKRFGYDFYYILSQYTTHITPYPSHPHIIIRGVWCSPDKQRPGYFMTHA